MYLPAGFLTALAQGLQKTEAILVILKDGIAPISSIHDMVNGTGILDPQLARHDAKLSKLAEFVNSFD